MKHGVWAMNYPSMRTVGEVVEFACAAEQAGWDGVFVSDSITDGTADPWVTLGAIAARTERISLGTWISAPATYQPWRLALAAASLDQLSDGRVMLGVGLGTDADFFRFGDDAPARERARRYDEALEIIRLLWTGEPVTFVGEFFRLDDVVLPVVPVQRPRIPTLIAGWWPNRRPFRRAARWDGTMPYWPALLGAEDGADDGAEDGAESPMPDGNTELRDLMAFCREVSDGIGEVVLPRQERDDHDFRSLAREVGATWLLTTYRMDLDELRAGPPRQHGSPMAAVRMGESGTDSPERTHPDL